VKENLLLGKLDGHTTGKQEIPDDIFMLFPVLKSMLSRMGGDLSGGTATTGNRTPQWDALTLLLDEPTEGIPTLIILQIAAVRRIVASTGISVLLVEQHLHFARQADHYYAMQKAALSPWLNQRTQPGCDSKISGSVNN